MNPFMTSKLICIGKFYLIPTREEKTSRSEKILEGQNFIQNVEGFIGADKKTNEGGQQARPIFF